MRLNDRQMELYTTYRAALASFATTLFAGLVGLGISQEIIISLLSVIGAGLTAVGVQFLKNRGDAAKDKFTIAWLEEKNKSQSRMNDLLCDEITSLHKENAKLRAQIPEPKQKRIS